MLRDKPVRLVLVAVGATTWQESGRLCGSTDLPLCDEGLRLCRETARAMTETLDVILTGPDEASETTAREFADINGGKVRIIDDLREIDMGLWEGMLTSEAEAKFPSVYKQWRSDPWSVVPPGGEMAPQAEARLLDAMVKAFDKLRPDHRVVGLALKPVMMEILGRLLAEDFGPEGEGVEHGFRSLTLSGERLGELRRRVKALRSETLARPA